MPFHSQRNVTVSAGDAAVLIRAMNRQRTDDATASRSSSTNRSAFSEDRTRAKRRTASMSEGTAADLDRRVLSFDRRTSTGRTRATTSGSTVLPSDRHHSPHREGEATTAGAAALSGRRKSSHQDSVAVRGGAGSSHGRPKPGSAGRAAERGQVELVDRRVRRIRAWDGSSEAPTDRAARATGSRSRSTSSDRTPRRDANPLAAWFAALAPRTHRVLIGAVCAVALVAFFYGPTADLYAAARDHEQLAAKVEATKAIADDLKAEVARLQTEEGVMDEARIRGYAAPGEVAADASELLGIEDTVTVPELSTPIETEEPPLYIQALDVLMGYEEHV